MRIIIGFITVQPIELVSTGYQRDFMKVPIFLRAMGFALAVTSLPSQAALLVTGQNPSSPYYADFNASGLSVSYNYNTSTGIGTFTASDSGSKEAYTSGSLSPGTHGTYTSTGFNGSYSLTATIQDISGNWEVTGGSVTVKGNLFFPGDNTQTGDLLLSANLKTGLNTIGYGAGGTKEFDFLFTATGGNLSILEDFFGVNQGQGAIILNTGAYGIPAYTDLSHSFNNTGAGFADTFVPEPAAYSWAASVVAFLGIAFTFRKSGHA